MLRAMPAVLVWQRGVIYCFMHSSDKLLGLCNGGVVRNACAVIHQIHLRIAYACSLAQGPLHMNLTRGTAHASNRHYHSLCWIGHLLHSLLLYVRGEACFCNRREQCRFSGCSIFYLYTRGSQSYFLHFR